MSGLEIEAKFYVRDYKKIKMRLRELKAHLVQRRTHEANFRFDAPDRSLREQGRVLRLRQDSKARMTYKGPSETAGGVMSRIEIEFVVENLETARKFLESLGYQKFFYYEKRRAIYELGKTHIMLDEMPYGLFVEIEDEKKDRIRIVADKLGLAWDAAVSMSYQALFERVRERQKLGFTDLSFKNFEKISITPAALGVESAG